MARLIAAPASESRDAIADRLLCASEAACDRSAEALSVNTAELHATRALSAARRFDSTEVLRLESLTEKVSDGLVRGLLINWSSVLRVAPSAARYASWSSSLRACVSLVRGDCGKPISS